MIKSPLWKNNRSAKNLSAIAHAIVIGFISVLFASSCTRPLTDTKAKVSFMLPMNLSSKLSALSSSPKLAHVVINITAADLKTPVMFTWDSCDYCTNQAAQTSFVVDGIPSGTGRLFQVIAVYKDATTQAMTLYYGDVGADITTDNFALSVPVTSIGVSSVITGNVSGRYLTGTDSGPSGNIDIRYNPGSGKPPLLIQKASILNGWFSFFMLTGAKLEYYWVEAGVLLWGSPTSLDDPWFDPGTGGGSQASHLLKAYIPVHIRVQNNNGSSSYGAEDAEIYVWGYWGTGSSSKFVCTNGLVSGTWNSYSAIYSTKLTQYTASNPSSSSAFNVVRNFNYPSASPLPTATPVPQPSGIPTVADLQNVASPMSNIVFYGGYSTDMQNFSGMCNGIADTATNQYLSFQKVSFYNFDGNGNDNAAGFRGYSRFNATNNDYVTIYSNPKIITGQVLPGINSVISGYRIFKRFTIDGYRSDGLACADIAAGVDGFVPADNAEASFDASGNYIINSNITAAEAAVGVSAMVCSVYNGALTGRGYFLDTYRFSNSINGPLPGTYGATQLTITGDVNNQNITGQCNHFTIQAVDAVSTPKPATGGSLSIAASSMGGTSVAVYTDPSCSNLLPTPIPSATPNPTATPFPSATPNPSGTPNPYPTMPSLNTTGAFDFYALVSTTSTYSAFTYNFGVSANINGTTLAGTGAATSNPPYMVLQYNFSSVAGLSSNPLGTSLMNQCRPISLAVATDAMGSNRIPNPMKNPVIVIVGLGSGTSQPFQIFNAADPTCAGTPFINGMVANTPTLSFTMNPGANNSDVYYIKSVASTGSTPISIGIQSISVPAFWGTATYPLPIQLQP